MRYVLRCIDDTKSSTAHAKTAAYSYMQRGYTNIALQVVITTNASSESLRFLTRFLTESFLGIYIGVYFD